MGASKDDKNGYGHSHYSKGSDNDFAVFMVFLIKCDEKGYGTRTRKHWYGQWRQGDVVPILNFIFYFFVDTSFFAELAGQEGEARANNNQSTCDSERVEADSEKSKDILANKIGDY